ncbi:MAG: low molecular weight protein arginine phosphatase [candidate division Zixibacteria bacterium]|nr:low molecular weight protein arginine phosphatase [candidate division Zixibacteria bacterium]
MTANPKYKVLIVCTGNTCRSAMAKGILRKVAEERKLNNLEIYSAGTGAMAGMPATDYAIAAAAHWDIDISGHRSTALTPELIKNSNLILAMAPEHADTILSYDRATISKLHLFKGFPLSYERSQAGVDDPIGGSLEQYNQTFLELDEITRNIFPQIIKLSRADD